MPLEPVCASGAAAASFEAGVELPDYADVSEDLGCDSESSCLAAVRKLTDPTHEIQAQRAAEIALAGDALLDPGAFVDRPVLIDVRLQCLSSPGWARWWCDGASCSLTTSRPIAGLAWSRPWSDRAPGSESESVADLVATPDPELIQLGPTKLAIATRAVAARMVGVLDQCESGGRCAEGWRAVRAYAQSFADAEPPQFAGVNRDLWSTHGFAADFMPSGPVQPAGIDAELSCYAISGDCDMHEEACTLALRRNGAEFATFRTDTDAATWGEESFALAELGTGVYGYVHAEGHSAR
jgi:hypothetical protein